MEYYTKNQVKPMSKLPNISFHAVPTSHRRVGIRCTVTVMGIRSTPFSTGITCAEKDWQTNTNTIKGNPEDTEHIRNIEAHIKQLFNEQDRKGINLTASELVSLYKAEQNKVPLTFEQVAEEHLNFIELQEGKRYGKRSIETYHVYHNTFLSFLKNGVK